MATESTADDKDIKRFTYDLMEIKLDASDKTVSCKLKMPSKLAQRYERKDLGNNPKVLLDLQSSNNDGDRCFQIMKEVIHPNILHARGINKIKSQLLLWVEPYSGNLLDFLETTMTTMTASILPRSKKTVLPTKSIQKIVSQIVDGLNYLRMQGSYHGNFTLEGTYYCIIKSEIIVKLTNFKDKGAMGSVSLYQLDDLKDLGTAIVCLSNIAHKLSKESMMGHTYDTLLLDDLAKKLAVATQKNLGMTYEVIKKHPFFWKAHERKRFFIYRVAVKMKNSKFRSKVQKCEELCSLPWNADDHNGFLQMMNKFRAMNLEPDYNGFSRCEFVLFICGLYGHEHEPTLLTNGKKVDETVTSIHPHICLVLCNLLQDNKVWL